MGWRELRHWLGVRKRQLEAEAGLTQPDPNRWTDASKRNFDDLDAQRRKLRGRR